MKKSLAALFIVATTLSVASAQPPGERGGPGGGRRPPNAVLAAIDSNGDHEITTDEMKKAFTALKKLDSNKNGKLDREEIHPEMAGGPGRPRGPRDGGPGGEADGRQSVVERIQGFDKNNDGKLTKDEVPARMQRIVARYDKNKDAVLDQQELAAMSEQLAASVPERSGPRGRGGFDGPPGVGPRGGGQRGGGRGGPGGGPPSPEQTIQDAFEFDANNDGQLSKSELQRFAESHAQRGGPGGGRGGRGGPGGRGGDRPNRPARPNNVL